MSPLEVYRSNQDMQELANLEKLTLHGWSKVLGIAPPTIKSAALRAGIQLEEGVPKHPNMPVPLLIEVSKFPDLVRGFQKTGLNPNGEHFHDWTLGVNTQASEFLVNTGDRKRTILVYKAEQ